MKSSSLRPSPKPITNEERSRCERVGIRLKEELRSLLYTLPESASTVRGMADCLGVDRNICHRIRSAIKIAEGHERVLAELPGLSGLDLFVSGFRTRGMSQKDLTPIAHALDEYRKLIVELATSRSRFVARLNASAVVDFSSEARAIELRRKRYQADADILGITVEARVVVDAYAPIPGDEGHFEHSYAGGFQGVRTRNGGVPFLLTHSISPGNAEEARILNFQGEPLSNDPTSQFLREFSTSPLPDLTSKGTDLEGIYVVDHESRGDDPFDLFIGRRISPAAVHPRIDAAHLLVRSIAPRDPSRVLIIDTYLHKSMARDSVPSAGAYLRSPGALGTPSSLRWFDRLPSSPRLEILGNGNKNAATPAYARHPELTNALFDNLEWPADEFVGYRLLIEYPITGVDYSVSFDFSPTD